MEAHVGSKVVPCSCYCVRGSGVSGTRTARQRRGCVSRPATLSCHLPRLGRLAAERNGPRRSGVSWSAALTHRRGGAARGRVCGDDARQGGVLPPADAGRWRAGGDARRQAASAPRVAHPAFPPAIFSVSPAPVCGHRRDNVVIARMPQRPGAAHRGFVVPIRTTRRLGVAAGATDACRRDPAPPRAAAWAVAASAIATPPAPQQRLAGPTARGGRCVWGGR